MRIFTPPCAYFQIGVEPAAAHQRQGGDDCHDGVQAAAAAALPDSGGRVLGVDGGQDAHPVQGN